VGMTKTKSYFAPSGLFLPFEENNKKTHGYFLPLEEKQSFLKKLTKHGKKKKQKKK
jgi:hypothetical protein